MRKESRFRNVIIVEDDDVDAYINHRLVESSGLAEKIEVFLHSDKAISFISENLDNLVTPAVIMLDLNMPVMDGFEFLRAIQGLDPREQGISVIVVTGIKDPEEKEKVLKYDFVLGYVEKPVTVRDLSHYFLP